MRPQDVKELDGLVAGRQTAISAFRDEQPEIWLMVNSAYLSAWQLAIAAATRDHGTAAQATDAVRSDLWLTLIDYQMSSFLLLIQRQLGAGVALLRLASELGRDVPRIGASESRLDAWLTRRSSKDSDDKYRKQSRFDETNNLERFVHQLYDLASVHGVHGHMLDSSHSVPTDVSPNGTVLRLEVPDLAASKTLSIWLGAAFPLNELCARTFPSRQAGVLAEAYAAFRSWTTFDELLAVFRRSMSAIDADILGTVH
jgi:hypothetical protein